MKIKKKKKLNLPQLIEWVWKSEKSDVKAKYFKCKEGNEIKHIIYANPTGRLNLDSERYYDKNDLFTVEVEEELTEDTEFEHLIEVTKDEFHIKWSDSSVAGQMMPVSKEYHAYIDGEFKLIWTHEKGLVE